MRFIISITTYFFIFTTLCIAAACGALMFIYHNRCVDFTALTTYNEARPSIVLDDEGTEWARFQLDWREPITLEQLPPHLINAFIAAEDWSFFSHNGISLKGIIRSTLVNLYHRRKMQGASTITQQLVRLLLFDSAKTFARKLKEQCMAIVVEQQYTKEQILETYLNHVYFGCGIYGVEAAAQRFWNKSAAHVTVDEAAVLAAIMRSPARYCPLLCPLSCEKRRNSVLASMRKLNFIDDATYATTRSVPLTVIKDHPTRIAPHLQEHIRIELEELIGKTTLYTEGLVIQTTLNKTIQANAQIAFNKQCSLLKKDIHPSVDGGLITIDTKTGAIKALVGGYDFATSKWNRALQARRQIGSTFKPLIYACAIEDGALFSDLEVDEPLELAQASGVWRPRNVHEIFEGTMTLARALSRSNNIIAIKTLLSVGYDPVIALARRCGISAPLHKFPSLALGCVDTTVKEVVGMFNVFAHHGTYVAPHAISWIKDQWGTKIWRYQPVRTIALSPQVSDQVAKVLEIGLNRIRPFIHEPWIETAAISKTGTTNDSRTCWFVGSSPNYTTAIYVGRDDNHPLGTNIYPLKTAFPIWLNLHRSLTTTPQQFTHDPSLQVRHINEWTGQTRSAHDKTALPIFTAL